MRALLDVNVLIALLDTAHIGHATAYRWLSAHIQHGWATCPITQNGCIRIMAQPAYPGAFAAAEVAARLSEAVVDVSHEFWADDISLLQPGVLNWPRILGHRQVTDSYLLALAVHHHGRFVTFDTRISPLGVPGATDEHWVVL